MPAFESRPPRTDGCWLFPAVGSGVWLSTGARTLSVSSLAALRLARFGGSPRGVRQDGVRYPPDFRYAREVRRRGYATLQILRGNAMPLGVRTHPTSELVLATDRCMDALAPLPAGCLPDGVQLRAGDGMHSCVCNRSLEVLNCVG